MPNAKVLESKKAVVDALTSKVKEASSVVFVDYKGITVAQDTELRKQFREAGVDYAVVKNTLTNFAAKNAGYDFSEVLNGTTAMASTTGDPIAPALRVCQEDQAEDPGHQGRRCGRLRAFRRPAERLRRAAQQERSGRFCPGYLPGAYLQPGLRSGSDPDAEGRLRSCRSRSLIA